ncbi:MAG: homoserine kinase [Actinomycetes bacterium]
MNEFVRATVSVRVPATSANLGPGFDSYGLALDLHDELSATLAPELRIDVTGEGDTTLPRDETHLVWQAMQRLFAEVGVEPPGVHLVCHNKIPHGRGLGSSAAAIVAGLLLARALLVETQVSDQRILELASELEGHPDNVAAALYGGFTLAWIDSQPVQGLPGGHGSAQAVRMEPFAALRVVVVVPETMLATSRARAVLPASVPHCDAVINVARAGLLVEALTRRPDLLLPATFDRLHQEQRREAYPETWREVELLRDAGLAAVVSGAGPTVLVLSVEPILERVRELVGSGLDVRELGLDLTGARVGA